MQGGGAVASLDCLNTKQNPALACIMFQNAILDEIWTWVAIQHRRSHDFHVEAYIYVHIRLSYVQSHASQPSVNNRSLSTTGLNGYHVLLGGSDPRTFVISHGGLTRAVSS